MHQGLAGYPKRHVYLESCNQLLLFKLFICLCICCYGHGVCSKYIFGNIKSLSLFECILTCLYRFFLSLFIFTHRPTQIYPPKQYVTLDEFVVTSRNIIRSRDYCVFDVTSGNTYTATHQHLHNAIESCRIVYRELDEICDTHTHAHTHARTNTHTHARTHARHPDYLLLISKY